MVFPRLQQVKGLGIICRKSGMSAIPSVITTVIVSGLQEIPQTTLQTVKSGQVETQQTALWLPSLRHNANTAALNTQLDESCVCGRFNPVSGGWRAEGSRWFLLSLTSVWCHFNIITLTKLWPASLFLHWPLSHILGQACCVVSIDWCVTYFTKRFDNASNINLCFPCLCLVLVCLRIRWTDICLSNTTSFL